MNSNNIQIFLPLSSMLETGGRLGFTNNFLLLSTCNFSLEITSEFCKTLFCHNFFL